MRAVDPMIRLFLVLCALACTATLVERRHAAAQEGRTVAVAPASNNVEEGSTFSLDVTVTGVTGSPGIGGYVVGIGYDPGKLTLQSLVDAGFVTDGDVIVICSAPSIDNTAGLGVLACVPLPLFGGDGVTAASPTAFARATFRAKGTGSTEIELDGTYLQDPLGGTFSDVALIDGHVTVEEQAEETVTPVPSATPVASATLAASETAAPPSPSGTASGAISQVSSTIIAGSPLSNIEGPSVGSGPVGAGRSRTGIVAALAGSALAAAGVVMIRSTRRRGQR